MGRRAHSRVRVVLGRVRGAVLVGAAACVLRVTTIVAPPAPTTVVFSAWNTVQTAATKAVRARAPGTVP